MKWLLGAMLAAMAATVAIVLWKRRAMLRELWLFLRSERKWWLTPILLVLLLVMALMIAQASQPWMAFIYPIH